jgi:hypothetical protein
VRETNSGVHVVNRSNVRSSLKSPSGEIWAAPSLVNARTCQGFHDFGGFFALLIGNGWASVRRPELSDFDQ